MQATKKLLHHLIDEQHRLNRETASRPRHLALQVNTPLLKQLYARRDDVVDILHMPAYRKELIAYMVQSTQKQTYFYNQFVRLSGNEVSLLQRIYVRLLVKTVHILQQSESYDLCEQEIAELLHEHSNLLSTYYGHIHDEIIMQDDHQVPCFEYEALFQLQLLGIDLETLQEPVLDVGCGAQAHLVNYLRQQGFEAYGIDRTVTGQLYCQQLDWFAYPLQQGFWGTIISHMALSNHFIHHHLRQDGHPEAYAHQMIRLLGSLQHSGTMYYAPGLPFVEKHLPTDMYQITTQPLSMPPGDDDKVISDYRYAVAIQKRQV